MTYNHCDKKLFSEAFDKIYQNKRELAEFLDELNDEFNDDGTWSEDWENLEYQGEDRNRNLIDDEDNLLDYQVKNKDGVDLYKIFRIKITDLALFNADGTLNEKIKLTKKEVKELKDKLINSSDIKQKEKMLNYLLKIYNNGTYSLITFDGFVEQYDRYKTLFESLLKNNHNFKTWYDSLDEKNKFLKIFEL